MYLFVTHLVGAVGGYFGKKRGIPAGAMIGAMLAVVLMNTVVGTAAHYPIELRVAVQIFSGLVIGSRFSRSDLKELRKMLKPALILIVMLFGLNLSFAFLITKVSEVSWITALFACAPGGLSDLALVAVEFGARTEQVTLLQLFRFIFVVAFFPNFIKNRYLKDRTPSVKENTSKKQSTASHKLPPANWWAKTILSSGIAAGGAILLRVLGVPAGAIIGSIVATIILNLAADVVTFPSFIKVATRVLAGCYIGSQVNREAILSLGGLILPLLFVILEVGFMAFGTAYIIHKFTGLDKVTALFCCIPGGIAEMGLIAEELELDTPKIVLMHTCRVISVICVMPIVVKLFA